MERGNSQKIIIEQLSQDLEDLEVFLKDLWDFLPLPLCYLNPLLKILDINKAFENLFGWQRLELVGREAHSLFANRKLAQKIFQTLTQRGKIFNKEGEILTKERKVKIVNISASPRKDKEGNIIGYYFTFSDISEFKRLQEKLEKLTKELELNVKERTKKLQEKLKELEDSRKALINMLEDFEEERRKVEEERNKIGAIINNFADGLLFFDKENKLAIINPEAEKYFGLLEEKIKGEPASKIFQLPGFESLFQILGPELKKVFRKEFPFKKRTFEVTSVPIGREEERIGTLIIFHDVTREKQIEKMKTEFVSIAAHQLRTPLSIIKWSLSLLMEEKNKLGDEEKDLIEKAYKTNERMITLVNDLLNVARIEEGRFVYQPTVVEFDELVKKVFDSLKELAKKKNLLYELEIKESKKPKVVKVDIEKMTLVIKNLIENAIHYTREGGKIKVTVKREDSRVLFSVKDTGVGIPKDQQKRVFSRFFRGANVIRMETEGTGLGLFISKNIVEAHKGKIWFKSKENKGTTFFFTLPTIV